MIFIGLDISKVSTAMCIEKNGKTKLYSYTTKKSGNCWVKDTKDFINYRHINYEYLKEKDYSKSELMKITEFSLITDSIINDIFNNVKILDSITIAIEGYSYNSKQGPIIDIVEFTSILKHKLLSKLSDYSKVNIIAPLILKTEACKMVYKPRIEIKGKRKITEIIHLENNNGKQATKFDKWDMFYAFIESDIKSELKDWCKEYSEEISKNKEVPKPLDDVIDSFFLKEMIKKI
jgi:hypothetical protein